MRWAGHMARMSQAISMEDTSLKQGEKHEDTYVKAMQLLQIHKYDPTFLKDYEQLNMALLTT
jgi:hypothetical protein